MADQSKLGITASRLYQTKGSYYMLWNLISIIAVIVITSIKYTAWYILWGGLIFFGGFWIQALLFPETGLPIRPILYLQIILCVVFVVILFFN